ncbi:DUF2442 domain-containing protein [Rhizobium sp. C4]|uniref:DUF2442 domain-containing protein n=1 Tax=Rhizobium sp. C4 TaxID=1349800 RepID=UPI001E4E32A9|nr:DUF2442 domain-containing protein [Rhizobium sp. C4]MCD2173121.1 DUF2442 domain-containing protein [Rhizobium sp. C4]
MRKLKDVVARPEYELQGIFDGGLCGVVELKNRLFGVMFEPLRDLAFFACARVDSFGAVVWPNGADLDPAELYALLLTSSGLRDRLEHGYREMAADRGRETEANEWVEAKCFYAPSDS